MEELLKQVLRELVALREVIANNQDDVMERLDDVDEALRNVSTPGTNYGVFSVDEDE